MTDQDKANYAAAEEFLKDAIDALDQANACFKQCPVVPQGERRAYGPLDGDKLESLLEALLADIPEAIIEAEALEADESEGAGASVALPPSAQNQEPILKGEKDDAIE